MSLSLKDIHQTIQNLHFEGHKKKELEAILVNGDDLVALFQELNSDDMCPAWNRFAHGSGEIKIYGVKIIESQQVEPGSIFNIYKNNKSCMMPQKTNAHGPDEVNGMTKFGPYVGDDVIEQCNKNRYNWKPTAIDCVESKSKQKPKPKKKKYSLTRRIELDQ